MIEAKSYPLAPPLWLPLWLRVAVDLAVDALALYGLLHLVA